MKRDLSAEVCRIRENNNINLNKKRGIKLKKINKIGYVTLMALTACMGGGSGNSPGASSVNLPTTVPNTNISSSIAILPNIGTLQPTTVSDKTVDRINNSNFASYNSITFTPADFKKNDKNEIVALKTIYKDLDGYRERQDFAVVLGSEEVGLSYVDFGYVKHQVRDEDYNGNMIDMRNSEYATVNKGESGKYLDNYDVYNTRDVLGEDLTFTGRAYAVVTAGGCSDFVNSKSRVVSGDATLIVTSAEENLNVSFDNWYNMSFWTSRGYSGGCSATIAKDANYKDNGYYFREGNYYDFDYYLGYRNYFGDEKVEEVTGTFRVENTIDDYRYKLNGVYGAKIDGEAPALVPRSEVGM